MSSEKYRDTLNLLATNFPIRADFINTDQQIQAKWERIDICENIKNININKEKFILHDGPPYSNGDIHLGHAYNKILKDIVSKSMRMMGYNVNVIPGWDCHGLPIEKKVAEINPELKGSAMQTACRVYAQKWIDIQKESFKKLGIFMDWNNPYATMNFKYEANTLQAFASLVEKGFINRARKTIPWCFNCETALASAEIEYKDRKDPSVYVLFKFESIPNFLKDLVKKQSLYCMIWTTTPWTLPLNRGVMLRKNSEYSLVKSNDKYIIVGSYCIKHLETATEFKYEILNTFNSSLLKDSKMFHCFENSKLIPFVYDESVEEKEGTACIHTAPGCGQLDYEIGVKNGLEIYSPVENNGKYSKDIYPKELEGMLITDGQWWILKQLQEKEILWHKGSIRHNYPHCWRCREGLIFRATPQWFCNLEKNNLKEKTLNAISKIKFFPSNGKNFLEATISSRWEWCLSRQRAWGTPITALISEDGDEYFIDADLIRSIANSVEKNGIEYWQNVSIEDLVKNHNLNQKYLKEEWRKEYDILDVWFDSGVSHTAVLKELNNFPANCYLEGIDQHRGWFQSSLITSMTINQEAPMKNIITHGFTVDEKGQKMSKSLGNGVEPQDIAKGFGLDGLRLWVSSISNEGDVVYSKKVMDNVSEVYRKIRNNCRFILQNIADFDFEKDKVLVNELEQIDLYAVKRMYEISLKCMNSYYKIQFAQIYHMIADFCSNFLSSVYFDVIKDTLYCDKKNLKKRRSTQTALYIILDSISKIMAPIMSHTTDLIFENYNKNTKNDSIHLKNFYRFEYLKELGEEFNLTSNSILKENEIENKLNLFNKNQVLYFKEWNILFKIRDLAMKQIEILREQGIVKQSMEASIEFIISESLDISKDLKSFIFKFSKEFLEKSLSDIFIISEIKINFSDLEKDIICKAKKHDGRKCERCWKWYFEGNEEICSRCIEAIK